jgi:hypothetical protein
VDGGSNFLKDEQKITEKVGFSKKRKEANFYSEPHFSTLENVLQLSR